MKKMAGHIISNFVWNTSFNKKESAVELQERLSNWSKQKMQKEIMSVFDKVCPPEQTWRIQSLELDFGIIDYNNLEADMTLKLNKQLNEKLIDMLIYEDNGNKNIEIFTENFSRLNSLKSFFINGVFEWEIKQEEGSVNELLDQLLKSNKDEIIAMIIEVGSKHIDIRKRIAWQVKEPLIIKIIEGLEPGNSDQIIDFSKELIAINNKETIVQASVAELKGNVWFWVLNYLLTERGTVFNKIAFIKSSIMQMANHYNISYTEFLSLIERAINIVSKRFSIKSDFVVTIQALTKEQEKTTSETTPPLINNTDKWHLLRELFFNDSLLISIGQKEEFNYLVMILSNKSNLKFRRFILSVGISKLMWQKVINSLNDNTLEVIIESISPPNAFSIIESVHFIKLLNTENKLGLNRNDIWNSGIRLIYANKNTVLNEEKIFDHLITDLLMSKDTLSENMLIKLVKATVDAKSKTISTLKMHKKLSNTIFLSGGKIDTQFFEKYLKELLEEIVTQLSYGIDNTSRFLQIKNEFLKNIHFNTELAFKIIESLKENYHVSELLSMLLKKEDALLLVIRSKTEISKVVELLIEALSITDTNTQDNSAIELIKDQILKAGLMLLINNPACDKEKCKEFIFKEISYTNLAYISEAQLKIGFERLSPAGFNAENYSNDTYEKENTFTIIQIFNLLEKKKSREEVLYALKQNFSDTEFVKFRAANANESNKLLDFIIAGGSALRVNLIDEYTGILKRELNNKNLDNVEKVLNELYWNCLLSSTNYYGQVNLIRNSFKALVLSHFSVNKKISNTTKIKVGISLENGLHIEANELFSLLKVCFEKSLKTTDFKGSKISLQELVYESLENDPAELRAILANCSLNTAFIKNIQKNVPFDHFCIWIAHDMTGLVAKGIKDIYTFSTLILHQCSTSLHQELLLGYWAEVLNIIRTGQWKPSSLKKLVQDSLTKVSYEDNLSGQSVIDKINKSTNGVSHELMDILLECFPLKSFKEHMPLKLVITIGDVLSEIENKDLLYEFCYHLIHQQQIPDWITHKQQTVSDCLNELIIHHPVTILQVLKQEFISENQMDWICRTINFKQLIVAIGILNKHQQNLLTIIAKFYFSVKNISIASISGKEIQAIIFRKTIKAWTSNNWRIINTDNIWNELMWEICLKRNISNELFFGSLEKQKTQFPLSLQISLNDLKNTIVENKVNVGKPLLSKPIKKLTKTPDLAVVKREGLIVKNAGLVLVNNYVTTLFDRIGVTKNKEFTSNMVQVNAVHYLQYVATGLSETEESLLALNKVLCGVPLQQPISSGIEISDEKKQTISGLIKAIIDHWPSIGDTSVNGFRGNWLVRDGKLIEQEDRWELIVEKRAYDLLIHKSPFSFSIIKYPWMSKPLHVSWPY